MNVVLDTNCLIMAISAQNDAKHIVIHDHHFNILKQIAFPKVDVITLKEFLEDLQQK